MGKGAALTGPPSSDRTSGTSKSLCSSHLRARKSVNLESTSWTAPHSPSMFLKSSIDSLTSAPAMHVLMVRSHRPFSLCVSSVLQLALRLCISENRCCLRSAMVSHWPSESSSLLSGLVESFWLCGESLFFIFSLQRCRLRLCTLSLAGGASIL